MVLPYTPAFLTVFAVSCVHGVVCCVHGVVCCAHGVVCCVHGAVRVSVVAGDWRVLRCAALLKALTPASWHHLTIDSYARDHC